MCHPERSEGSRFLAQGKLSEGSHEFLRFAQDMLRLTPQNDIVTQSLDGGGERVVVEDADNEEVLTNDLYASDHGLRLPDGWEGDTCSPWPEFHRHTHL